MSKKLWGGRFSSSSSDITERISMSVHYDSRLYKQDIRGSRAHADMLLAMKVLTQRERDDIHEGLDRIEQEIESGEFSFNPKYEDIHMNIEARLTELVGDAGRRLHTARSRNDQIAVDTRLYVKESTDEITALLTDLLKLLLHHAKENTGIILPGYTHLQIAQPVRLSHHLLAHVWALYRDRRRFYDFKRNMDECPLGAGALAGVNYLNDRLFLAEKLGFAGVTRNSMDTVADRDYLADTLYACSLLGVHLSRMCEELVLWSTFEYGFITLSDEVTTGSSIMPQKKNPDLAELIRGKSGRLTGNLVTLLTVMKGLPLTYNRDLQEDKEPLFDSIDTVKLSLEGMIAMYEGITFHADRMKAGLFGNFSTATDLADYLVKKGVPFRKSHEIVGSVVAYCEREKKDFFSLTVGELRQFSDAIDSSVAEVLSPESSTERKLSFGSTSIESVRNQIEELNDLLERTE
ncbi:MAG: argininosuccinate lyase [Spirochaetota bacterium]